MGITLDMVELAEQADTIVLASGDGDFDMALLRIHQRYNATTEVYGVRPLTAASLIDAAQKYVPIDEALLI